MIAGTSTISHSSLGRGICLYLPVLEIVLKRCIPCPLKKGQ